MAAIADLVMPKLGLTMSEGTISEWMVGPGQPFAKDDVVLVVETDKIANEIEAPDDGVLHEILVNAGETVAVGTPIGRWSIEGGSDVAVPSPPVEQDQPVTSPAPVSVPEEISTPKRPEGARIIATPFARRIAREGGVDLNLIPGSGPGGRIKGDDVRAAIEARDLEPDPVPPVAAAETKAEVPNFQLVSEVEVSALLDLRQRINARRDETPISINHFVIAAVGQALAKLRGGSDVGFAVDSDNGLQAPVLRDAGTKLLGTIAAETGELAARARGGSLEPGETTGAAITVSNVGSADVTYMTATILEGQSAAFGVGTIREVFRPDSNGEPELRRELGIVLSCDQRAHSAASGLALLNCIKVNLEDPMKLLFN